MSLTGLQGKVAVVTGGASGIGAAVVRRLSDEGARVVVVDRAGGAAERLAASLDGEAIAVEADVTSPDDTDRFFDETTKRFGRVDLVHLNAGIDAGGLRPLAESRVEDFDATTGVNIRGVYLGMRAAIRRMLDHRDGGAIVVTASAASFGGSQRSALYGTSKHAVVGLVKSAAMEYGRAGIRINAVCPGFVDTPLLEVTAEYFGGGDESAGRAAFEDSVPLGRYAQPSEIAAAVAWMLSEEASYATGALFSIDGGMVAGVNGYSAFDLSTAGAPSV